MGRRWLSPTNDNYSCWWTTTSIVGRQPAAPSRHPNHSASHPCTHRLSDGLRNVYLVADRLSDDNFGETSIVGGLFRSHLWRANVLATF
jgi:hypothetical protein